MMPFKDEDYIDEECVDDGFKTFEIKQEQRFQELIKFIDDFINSDEIQEHLRRKQAIVKLNKSTEISISECDDVEAKDVVLHDRPRFKLDFKKYPLTGLSLKKAHFNEKRERLRSQIDDAYTKKQLDTIDQIRVNISLFS